MDQTLFHLLVVDDDRRLRGLLEKYLSDQGYLVSAVDSAEAARQCLLSEEINLIVLDLMMPGESGLVFTEKLRNNTNHPRRHVPILMLTALSDPQQRIDGLEIGADDYLTKPFEPKELLLRIQRILERAYPRPLSDLFFGDFRYHTSTRTLYKGDGIVYLTTGEQNLLDALVDNQGRDITREELADLCGVSLSPRTIDVQITRLRRKIEEDPKKPLYIRTIRHRGYAFWPDA